MISTGCTMEHSFKFPHREEDVSTVLITYKCEDKIIIDKTLKDSRLSSIHSISIC